MINTGMISRYEWSSNDENIKMISMGIEMANSKGDTNTYKNDEYFCEHNLLPPHSGFQHGVPGGGVRGDRVIQPKINRGATGAPLKPWGQLVSFAPRRHFFPTSCPSCAVLFTHSALL